ncbi:hypothetical protein B0H13DRAFT_2573984 [Mycena leptocephala]|nr:hypothetical protein B0H13DRAFT_2573984 [Mycena leptocephala]
MNDVDSVEPNHSRTGDVEKSVELTLREGSDQRLQLYQIASVRTVTKTRTEKRRAILIDLAIGLGILLLQIPLRASPFSGSPILKLLSAASAKRTEPPSSSTPSPPSKVVLLSIKSFHNSRSQFRLLSASASANLNLNCYVRLMALASTDLFLTVPLASFVLYSNVAVIGLNPWVS